MSRARYKATVTYKNELPPLSNRQLRAFLHQMWIAGNNSYEIHETPEGIEQRNADISALLVREGFATPITQDKA